MKYYVLNFLVAIFLGIIIQGCSDLQTDIPPAEKKISVHQDGFVNKSSANFHGTLLKQSNWDMHPCQECHAADYSRVLNGVSCLTCHTSKGGPEACNTCHGDFSDPTHIAPPRAIDGETSTTSVNVGAHTNHMFASKLGSPTPCESCHKVPNSVYAEGHLNPPAGSLLTFSGRATSHGATDASFSSSNSSCSNTYCHGNFSYSKASAPSEDQFAFIDTAMVGISNTVYWTKDLDASQIKCGSCHALPPKGHLGYQDPRYDLTTCVSCHYGVVDAQGNIINKAKHINGVANVRGK